MSVQKVIKVLNELIEIHQELLELAEQKRHVLVHNQVDQLNQIVQEENKRLLLVSELEMRRMEAIRQSLIQRGYHPNPRITVSDLIRLIFKAEDKKALMKAHEALLTTLNMLQEHNRINRQLLEQSLAFIDYSLNLMIGMREDASLYRHPAASSPQHPGRTNRAGVFDTRA